MILSSTENPPRIARSIHELSQATGLSEPFFRNEIKKGNLKARRCGRRILVLEEDLREYLNREFVAVAAA